MFELKNITKTFGGEVALKNVSLSITGGGELHHRRIR